MGIAALIQHQPTIIITVPQVLHHHHHHHLLLTPQAGYILHKVLLPERRMTKAISGNRPREKVDHVVY
jgi:hypothetical protein